MNNWGLNAVPSRNHQLKFYFRSFWADSWWLLLIFKDCLILCFLSLDHKCLRTEIGAVPEYFSRVLNLLLFRRLRFPIETQHYVICICSKPLNQVLLVQLGDNTNVRFSFPPMSLGCYMYWLQKPKQTEEYYGSFYSKV